MEENGLYGSIISEDPTDEQDGERRESVLPFLSRRLNVLFQQAWSSHILYFGRKVNASAKNDTFVLEKFEGSFFRSWEMLTQLKSDYK